MLFFAPAALCWGRCTKPRPILSLNGLASTPRMFQPECADVIGGTGAVEVPVLPTIDAGGGVRWDPMMKALFISGFACRR